MKIITKRENHKIKPTQKIDCDCCGSTLEVTEEDFVKECTFKFFFPINVEYVTCPVCGVKLYKIPQNFWTRDLNMGIDYD